MLKKKKIWFSLLSAKKGNNTRKKNEFLELYLNKESYTYH